MPDAGYFQHLFYEWFVRYNPLYFVSAAWLIWAGFFLFHLISWIRFFEIAINLANIAPIFIILAFASKKEEAAWAGCILCVTFSSAYPPFFWLTAFLAGMVLCLNAWNNRQPRLYIGAILCFHFALATLCWRSGPFPDAAPWLPVLTGIGLVFIGWTYRLISAFCLVGLGLLVFWNPRGPRKSWNGDLCLSPSGLLL